MFTCDKIKDGSTYLSSHLTANDYYCENEHVTGVWVGKGAERLGLSGDSIGKDDAAFEALRRNLLPDGSGRLTPRRAENGIRFFDFQCSAQKSVSIMAVTLEDPRLYAAHDRAAATAFAELERFAAYRSGLSRQPQISGNVCAAAFRHDSSRALDPQLHTHFVVANATWNSGRKRWLALDTCEMFKAIRYAGKVYQNEMARHCRQLGYNIEMARNERGTVEGFEIKGVSSAIRERFSKRRAEVEAGIEAFRREKGRAPTTNEVHVITRETRNVKLDEISTPEVRARQRSQLSESELAALEAVKQRALAGAAETVGMGSGWRALMRARDRLYERHSVLRGHQLFAEALNQQLGYLDLATLKRYVTSDYTGMVRLAEHARNPLLSCQWASRLGLNLERWSIEFVNQTLGSCAPLGKTQGVAFDFKSKEQQDVVLVTLESKDRVYAIRGCAGAGKTSCLTEVRKGLEASGRTAWYLAPTASAVEVLRRDGFAHATTVDDFLTNQANSADLRGSVIVIDESSLQSVKMGASLLRVAQVRDTRVLLVGDIRQHVSVEAGDFLRILEQHSRLGKSELKDIRRQQVEEYNAAIRAMARGNALGGIEQLNALGWVQEGRGCYVAQAAEAYFEATASGKELDRCIAISPTWEEHGRFTQAIREGLKERKVLGHGTDVTVHEPLDWTVDQKSDAANYRRGMVVTFNARIGSIQRGQTLAVERAVAGRLWLEGHDRPIDIAKYAAKVTVSLSRVIEICPGEKILIRRNHREAGLVNGQVLTVTRLCTDGTLETREGKLVPAGFRHFCHGYVVTSHKARIFTPEKAHLLEGLQRASDRLAASDVIGTSRTAYWRHCENLARQRATHEATMFHAVLDRHRDLGIEMNH